MSYHDVNLRAEYPEIGAGGFSRVDGTVEFYLRINSLLTSNMVVLDYGAGRGVQLVNPKKPFVAGLATIKGKVRKIIGVDLDSAVLGNPFLDESIEIQIKNPLPFENEYFHLIYSDWVLEHVDAPAMFANEVWRSLKPGGWFCARTPNRWGITGIGANLIPNSLHSRFLNRLQPDREVCDVFPTSYKMNTMKKVKKYFPKDKWNNCSYYFSSEPPYIQGFRPFLYIAKRLMRNFPERFSTNLHIFLQKK